MTKEQKDYLDNLRLSGTTNMFDASTYLVGEFGLTKEEARKVLKEGMDTFKEIE